MYICSNCGYRSVSWIGRCPNCNQWNSMEKHQPMKKQKERKIKKAPVVSLEEIDRLRITDQRKKTGIFEFDRVLGNGLIPGEIILLSGQPGIGKSTLLLQATNNFSSLYVSGEESASQVKTRVQRLGLKPANYLFSEATQIEGIIKRAETIKDRLEVIIIDSIQTMYSEEIDSLPGTLSQIKTVAAKLIGFGKKYQIPIIIVGHITKEGTIAGPKNLEHMVDCVLLFQGEKTSDFRILRSTKNRFGPTDEIGIFKMQSGGLKQINDPLGFLENQPLPETSGKAIVGVMEGRRPFFFEVQSLAVPTVLAIPRRIGKAVDYNKLLLLTAVLQKHLRIPLNRFDLYVNVVGGVKLTSTSADLGITASIISSIKNILIPDQTVFIGEVGLLGEVRRVADQDKIIKEAKRLGFKKIYHHQNTKLIKNLPFLSSK